MVEAVVQAGRFETRYVRAGRGPHLLLLAEGAEAEWLRGLVPRLAERFRVFLPRVPTLAWAGPDGDAGGDPAAEWLRDLIDGLGLDRPGVVASGSLAGVLERFGDAWPERVERVVMVRTPALGAAPALAFATPGDERTIQALIAFLDG